MSFAQHHRELRVFQLGFDAAMKIFESTKHWPHDERYSLIDQIRRSSRSVCANIAEAWRKRRYEASLISKLADADAEIAETQVWLDFALSCGYIEESFLKELDSQYAQISGGLVKMMSNPSQWLGPSTLREETAPYETNSEIELDV